MLPFQNHLSKKSCRGAIIGVVRLWIKAKAKAKVTKLNYGTIVSLPVSDAPTHVLLQYRDHRQNTYYYIIAATLLLIAAVSLRRQVKKRLSSRHEDR